MNLPTPPIMWMWDGISSADMLANGAPPGALRRYVKAHGEDLVCGLAIPFGARDVSGEFFDRQTAFGELLGVPLLWEHGRDAAIKSTVLGEVVDATTLDDEGLWIEVQLRKHAAYLDRIRRLLVSGKLAFSSAAWPGLWRKGPDGRIAEWPLREISLTETPANRAATIYRP